MFADHKRAERAPIDANGSRDSPDLIGGLGCQENGHLHALVESITMNVGRCSGNAKVSLSADVPEH
jgi:hypothetical protein